MASAESQQPLPDEENMTNGWEKYFQENTLKIAWSLILFLGGMFVLIYFGHIEFLPEIDFTNATALLASIALVGLFFVFILGGVFVAPGLLLHYLVSTGLLTDQECREITSQTANLGNAEPSKSKIDERQSYLALVRTSSEASLVAGTLQVIVILIASWEWLGNTFPPIKPFQPNLYGSSFLVALVLLTWAIWKLYRDKERLENTRTTKLKKIEQSELKQEFKTSRWPTYQALGCLWFVIGAIPLLPFAAAYHGSDGWLGWFCLWAWLVWIGVSNSFWGCDRNGVKWWLVGAIGLFSLYILALIASNPSILSVSAVRALGLGGIENVKLVVRKDGCRAIALTAGHDACSEERDGEPFVTGDVTLLSRIGSQYLIEACADSGKMIRIVLDKKDVISWVAPAANRQKKDKDPVPSKCKPIDSSNTKKSDKDQ